MTRWFVAVPVMLALVGNGAMVVYHHRSDDTATPNPRLPPGWAIGTIWVVLFGMLGHVAYLVRRQRALLALVGCILAYCAAYPFTAPATRPSLNAGALLLALVLVGALSVRRQTRAITWSLPFLAWTAYVNGVA